jgi:hypothetical protein
MAVDVDPSRPRRRPEPSTTTPEDSGIDSARRGARLRFVGLTVLGLFIVAGAMGVMGVRSRTVSAVNDAGIRLTVTYAAVTRPGLATPWDVTVERNGGFDEPLTVRTTSAYLAAFDENGLDPDPDASSTDATTTIWEFEPPEGNTLVVSFDARWEPGVQWKRQGTTTVSVGGESVTVSYTTWVWP